MSEERDEAPEAPTCPVGPGRRAGPWGLRAVDRFLSSPLEELYEQGFFDAPPEEIRIRLKIVDGKVRMVVYAMHQGRLNELVLPFAEDEVFAELCG